MMIATTAGRNKKNKIALFKPDMLMLIRLPENSTILISSYHIDPNDDIYPSLGTEYFLLILKELTITICFFYQTPPKLRLRAENVTFNFWQTPFLLR